MMCPLPTILKCFMKLLEKKDMENRVAVLHGSLPVEKTVTSLLMSYFGVGGIDKKVFRYNSGELSFALKLKMLRDIKVLTSQEFKPFELLSEIRNTFLHNYDCNTFISAIDGSERKNYFIKEFANSDISNVELRYKTGYGALAVKCMQICLEKITWKEEQDKNQSETFKAIIDHHNLLSKLNVDLIKKIRPLIAAVPGESTEISLLKQEIGSIIDRGQAAYWASPIVAVAKTLDNKDVHDAILRRYPV